MSNTRPTKPKFPPVRVCIFDVDGLLINSEDIYTEIYNNILRSYGAPDLPWSIKAKQQSRGREGTLQLLAWAQLPLTYTDWTAQVTAQHALFKTCSPLPGIPSLLSTLSSSSIHTALASSATSATFDLKTSHLPAITAAFPPHSRVFGDDKAMSEKRKKPMPDVFLLALERINESLGERVTGEECLVFEDSVAGVEAGRRAGMRVCWVPHRGLRGVWRGREEVVLGGRGGEGGVDAGVDEEGCEQLAGERSQTWSEDGWAEMLMSLEDFDYEHYGIPLKHS